MSSPRQTSLDSRAIPPEHQSAPHPCALCAPARYLIRTLPLLSHRKLVSRHVRPPSSRAARPFPGPSPWFLGEGFSVPSQIRLRRSGDRNADRMCLDSRALLPILRPTHAISKNRAIRSAHVSFWRLIVVTSPAELGSSSDVVTGLGAPSPPQANMPRESGLHASKRRTMASISQTVR